jgi:hypothetical protein
MQVVCRRSVACVGVGIVLLAMLATFFSPYVLGPPTHLSTGRLQVGQIALHATSTAMLQSVYGASRVITEIEQFTPATPILQRICVCLC